MSRTRRVLAAFVAVAAFFYAVERSYSRPSETEVALKKQIVELQAQLNRKEEERQRLEAEFNRLNENLKKTSAHLSEQPPMLNPVPGIAKQQPSGIEDSKGEEELARRQRRNNFRVGIAKRFLNLDEDASQRLGARLENLQSQNTEGDGPPGSLLAKAIEEEFGQEQADFFRNQMAMSFQRNQDEEDEKDVLLLSKRIGLNAEQEETIRSIYREAASQFRFQNPREYFLALRNRRELITQRLKGVLSPEQLEKYSQVQSQSAEEDLQIWH